MHASGIPLHQGLSYLSINPDEPSLSRISERLAYDLMAGYSLSACMARYPHVFDKFVLTMVKVGEKSGKLDAVFRALADHLEWVWANSAKLKSRLAYPAFSLALCLLMAIFGPSYLLRGQLEMLRTSGVELPVITKALILMSDLFHSPVFLVVMVLGLIGGFVALRRSLKTRPGQRIAYLGISRIPGLGPLVRTSSLARFARAFGLLLDAGVTVVEAIPLAFASTGNPLMEAEGPGAVQRLMAGSSLAESLCGTGKTDKLLRLSLETGEQSGTVSRCMEWIFKMYAEEVEVAYERITAMLEPLLMLFTGACVGLLLVATLLPTIRLLEVV